MRRTAHGTLPVHQRALTLILFKENGRLGNQLFQYCALRTLARCGETVCLFGFSDLESVFCEVDAELVNENAKKYKRSLYYRVYGYAEKLSKKSLIPVIFENADRELIETPAPFTVLKIARNVYFQSEDSFAGYIAARLRIRHCWLKRSKAFTADVTAQGYVPIFVHVRRGDYKLWPDANYPAILPAKYYREAIRYIRKVVRFPYFIFMSDDYEYVMDEFTDIGPRYISNNRSEVDFALMTECAGGILSASSFCWWGAYLNRYRDQTMYFVAPKYWGGHRKRQWYPRKIESSFITYINGT